MICFLKNELSHNDLQALADILSILEIESRFERLTKLELNSHRLRQMKHTSAQ